MGGSSLGPEVLARPSAQEGRFPKLHVLDSTDPAQVRAIGSAVELPRRCSSSRANPAAPLEPNVLKDYFFDRVAKAIGAAKAGHRFIAVTDPGSRWRRSRREQAFARIFYGEPSDRRALFGAVAFGLVPAAATRHRCPQPDHARAVDGALLRPDVPPHENPGVQLGLAMGLAGLEGRDKVTISLRRKIADFGAWAEQLIAESTGKDGKGLIPIDGEPLGDPRFMATIASSSICAPKARTMPRMTTGSRRWSRPGIRWSASS